jgi:outer membrane protein OmpA-like peptidoglycan-associated protein
MVLDETIHNFQATLGVVFAFGGDKKAAEVVSAEKSAVVGTAIAIAIASADTTPPTVTFTSPSKGSTDVEINRRVHVAFSEDMDPETITASTFSLKQGLTSVSGKVTSGPSTATFTPGNYLEKGKSYTATVTSGARDLAGNELARNYEWEFATGMAEDTTAPTVSFTSPGDGATAAPVKQKINVAFSEYMDPATITGATFILKQGATPVSGRVTSNAATATFTSFKNLEKGRPYTGIITTGATDLAGNALAKDYVWHFTAFDSPKVIAVLVKLEHSHFAFNSAEISEDGKTILSHNVKTLKDNPEMKILVSGYTSAAGTEEYNQKLSERRAESVKEYLVKTGGINGNRITSIGYGESHPAKYEADPSDKYSPEALANMRVIVEVIEE